MDIATLIGLVLAGVGIVGGLFLDGSGLGQVVRPAAAMIVLGGTAGAVFVSFPLSTLGEAFREMKKLVRAQPPASDSTMEEILAFALRARRDGLLVLERHVRHASDPLLRHGLSLVADGHDSSTIRGLLELKLQLHEENLERAPRVLEAAGGYAPTVGILGAVLGLIHVLHLNDFSNFAEVGTGIATAFVATLYGVGFANLVFLPMATKLRARQHDELIRKEMILEGVMAIQDGLSPHLLEDKLRSFQELAHARAA